MHRSDLISLAQEVPSPSNFDLGRQDNSLPTRVTWIANFVPPYAASMYRSLAQKIPQFRLLLSVAMEDGRTWPPSIDGPYVHIQRTVSWNYKSRHPHGFTDTLQMHFPYDTLPLLLKHKPQIIISSELGARTLQALVYRMLYPETRLIVRATVSEVSEQGRGHLRKQLRSILLSRADAVIVNGQSGSRYIRTFGVPDRKVFTVPYTTEATPFARVPLERPTEAAHRLLYVGQLIERKGLFHFLRIVREWASRHEARTLSLWIVGNGHLQGALEKYQFPSNVSVRFLGAVPYNQLPDIYAQCGLFAFPTLADEWGVVVNEAMAAGLPILGSVYSQAVEELVHDGKNGWCFRPDDSQDMYGAFDRAMNISLTKADEMRRDARKAVEYLTPSYASDAILDALRFVYQQPGGDPLAFRSECPFTE